MNRMPIVWLPYQKVSYWYSHVLDGVLRLPAGDYVGPIAIDRIFIHSLTGIIDSSMRECKLIIESTIYDHSKSLVLYYIYLLSSEGDMISSIVDSNEIKSGFSSIKWD